MKNLISRPTVSVCDNSLESLQLAKLKKYRQQITGACQVLQEIDAASDSMHLRSRYEQECLKLDRAKKYHAADLPALESRTYAMKALVHRPDLLTALLSGYQSLLEQLLGNSHAVTQFDLRLSATLIPNTNRAEPAQYMSTSICKLADLATVEKARSAGFTDLLVGKTYTGTEASFGFADLISGRLQQQALRSAALRNSELA